MDDDQRHSNLITLDTSQLAKIGKAIVDGTSNALSFQKESLRSNRPTRESSIANGSAYPGFHYNQTGNRSEESLYNETNEVIASTGSHNMGHNSAHRQTQSLSGWDHEVTNTKSFSYDSGMRLSCLAAASDGRSAAIAGKQHLHIVDLGNNVRSNSASTRLANMDGEEMLHPIRQRRNSNSIRDMEATRLAGVSQPKETIKLKLEKQYRPSALSWGHLASGSTLALGTATDDILLYSVAGGEINRSHTVKGNHARGINSMNFSSSSGGNLLTVASNDGLLRVWDIRQGLKRVILSMARPGEIAREAAFKPASEHKVAAIYDSGLVIRWDLRRCTQPDLRINAHIQGLCLDWHPSQNYLMTGGRDRRVHVWNMAKDSRTPDFSISTAGAVAQARWDLTEHQQIANSYVLTSGRQGFWGEMVACWSLKRSYTPIHCTESHEESIIGLSAVGAGIFWSASKNGVLMQHDLRREPLTWDSIPRATAEISSRNEISSVIQANQLSPYFRSRSPIAMAGSGHHALSIEPNPSSAPFFPSLSSAAQTPDTASSPGKREVSPSAFRDTLRGIAEDSIGENEGSKSNSAASSYSAHVPASRPSFPHFKPSQLTRSQSASDVIHTQRSSELGSMEFKEMFLYFVDLPCLDHESWCKLASDYKFTRGKNESLADVCWHNANVTRENSLLRTGQVWTMLAVTAEKSSEDFLRLVAPHLQTVAKQFLQGAETLWVEESVAERMPNDRALRDNSSEISRMAASLKKADLTGGEAAGLSSGSGDRDQSPKTQGQADVYTPHISSPLQTATATAGASAITNSQDAHHANAWLNLKSDQVLSGVSFTSASDGTTTADSDHRASRLSADPEDFCAGDGGETSKFASDFLSIASRRQSRTGRNSIQGSMLRPTLIRTDSNASQALSKSLDSASVDNTGAQHHAPTMVSLQPYYRVGSVNSEKMAVIAPDRDEERAGMTESQTASMLDSSFRDFVRSQRDAWDLLPMVKSALSFALNEDCQLMTTALLLIFGHLDSLVTKEQYNDIIVSCTQLLRSRQCFVAAAHISASSSAWSDLIGMSDPTALTICHRCEKPLSDNAAFMVRNTQNLGYWYCSHCRRQLDGCSYCNEIIKGLAMLTVECGHRIHQKCWPLWKANKINECSAGCGQVIII